MTIVFFRRDPAKSKIFCTLLLLFRQFCHEDKSTLIYDVLYGMVNLIEVGVFHQTKYITNPTLVEFLESLVMTLVIKIYYLYFFHGNCLYTWIMNKLCAKLYPDVQ